MVCSSVSIQYQRTGVSTLPSLSEIELRQTIRGLFTALSNERACIKYVIGNSNKISGASNMSKIMKIKSNASTQLIQQLTLCL